MMSKPFLLAFASLAFGCAADFAIEESYGAAADSGELGFVTLFEDMTRSSDWDKYEHSVDVMSVPSPTSEIVTTLESGRSFQILEQDVASVDGDGSLWMEILLPGPAGEIGYVRQRLVASKVIERVDESAYRNIPVRDCPAGEANLGILTATTEIFAEARMSSEILAVVPRGNAVKILSSGVQMRYIQVEFPDFDPEFHASGNGPAVQKRTGYILRAHIRVSNHCRDWGLDKMAALGAYELKASDVYISLSPEYRRTNISLASMHLDGHVTGSGEVFSYCEAILPERMADLATDGPVDVDRKYCPPGKVFDKYTGGCFKFLTGHDVTGKPIAWGGACGSASAVFRAAYRGGFPIHRKHDHGKLLAGLYDYPHYGPYYVDTSGLTSLHSEPGAGTDAAVFCDHRANPGGLEFGNDGSDSLVFVSATRLVDSKNAVDTYGPNTGVDGGDEHFHTFVHVYGAKPVDREVTLSPVLQGAGVKAFAWAWPREVIFLPNSAPPVDVSYTVLPGDASLGYLHAKDYSTDENQRVHLRQVIESSYGR